MILPADPELIFECAAACGRPARRQHATDDAPRFWCQAILVSLNPSSRWNGKSRWQLSLGIEASIRLSDEQGNVAEAVHERGQLVKAVKACAAAVSILISGSAFGAPSPLVTEAALQRAFTGYLQEWSSEGGITPEAMNRYYAARVIYYGKSMSRDEVFRDKNRYIVTWPERHYFVVPGSLSVRCNPDASVCRTRGLMRWDRRSATGVRSSGLAELTLIASRQSGGRIFRESAVIRK